MPADGEPHVPGVSSAGRIIAPPTWWVVYCAVAYVATVIMMCVLRPPDGRELSAYLAGTLLPWVWNAGVIWRAYRLDCCLLGELVDRLVGEATAPVTAGADHLTVSTGGGLVRLRWAQGDLACPSAGPHVHVEHLDAVTGEATKVEVLLLKSPGVRPPRVTQVLWAAVPVDADPNFAVLGGNLGGRASTDMTGQVCFLAILGHGGWHHLYRLDDRRLYLSDSVHRTEAEARAAALAHYGLGSGDWMMAPWPPVMRRRRFPERGTQT